MIRGKKKDKKRKKNSFSYKIKKIIKYIHNTLFDDEVSEYEKARFSILEVIGIIVVSILFGTVIGYLLVVSRGSVSSNKSNLSEIINTYNSITSNYYDKVDEDKLKDGAIKGMVESLDDKYSGYMDSVESNSFSESINGSYIGIGITVSYVNEHYVIVDVFSDSPADKAGIKVDDILLKVNNKNVLDLSNEEFIDVCRGKVNSKIDVVILRGEKEKTYHLRRTNIEEKVVDTNVFSVDDKNVGYIKILSFSSYSFSQFSNALSELEKSDISTLIVDVRDNLGGHLLQTRQILSLFFKKSVVLYQVEAKGKNKKVYSLNNDSRDYPIYVLINHNSASASEIVASCFMENYSNAFIIGETSYGKGTVQKTTKLSDGGIIKYTTQKWLTSNGNWINEIGVNPDLVVVQDSNYYDNPSYDNDFVLQRTFDKIKEKGFN